MVAGQQVQQGVGGVRQGFIRPRDCGCVRFSIEAEQVVAGRWLMRRRSPQEKKLLSYAKDRRNTYGENDKSSRKSIRRNKRAPHHADRRRANQILEAAAGAVDELAEEAAEQRLLMRRPKCWQKCPDAPLGEVVQHTLQRRMDLGIEGQEPAVARIRRVRRRLRQSAGLDPLKICSVPVPPEYERPREMMGCDRR
jgi:hypothetical protein